MRPERSRRLLQSPHDILSRRSTDKGREPVSVARDAERPASTARRKVADQRIQTRPLFGRED
jgi:hypothetical protein